MSMDTYKEAQEDDNKHNDEKETKKNSEVSKEWPTLKYNKSISPLWAINFYQFECIYRFSPEIIQNGKLCLFY